ncbi:hypothetical protein [Maridesulfovibrio sp.]|uniref:hypothetical protein n=1 Tax=Maridesulfovibrio sp. TaxID=2795000 RepID=UPI0029F484D4|nr:hypothetical protein [Maridesulfovibrio sp.]
MNKNEPTGIITELLSSLKNTVSEKIDNPLLFPFILAWVAWNYKFLLVLFSNEKITKKLEMIDQLYSCDWATQIWICKITYWVAIPLASAAIFILVFPLISALALWIWLKWITFRNNLILESRGKQVLSRERSNKILTDIANTENELEDAYIKIEDLNDTISQQDSEITRLGSASDGEDTTPNRIKMSQAARIVLTESDTPLTIDEIYDKIISNNLFTFGAKDPKGILRSTIRKECVDKNLKGSRKTRYFVELPNGKYTLKQIHNQNYNIQNE